MKHTLKTVLLVAFALALGIGSTFLSGYVSASGYCDAPSPNHGQTCRVDCSTYYCCIFYDDYCEDIMYPHLKKYVCPTGSTCQSDMVTYMKACVDNCTPQ